MTLTPVWLIVAVWRRSRCRGSAQTQNRTWSRASFARRARSCPRSPPRRAPRPTTPTTRACAGCRRSAGLPGPCQRLRPCRRTPTCGDPATAVEVAQRVECSECGGGFDLSARNVRLARQQAQPLVCRDCRVNRPPEITEGMRRWWLERFTLDELRQLPARRSATLTPEPHARRPSLPGRSVRGTRDRAPRIGWTYASAFPSR